MSAPARSLAQRMTALGEANRIRIIRAEAKALLRRGTLHWLDLFGTARLAGGREGWTPEDFSTMKVLDALMATPKVGRVKANRALAAARVSPSKTFGGISDRQRDELMMVLGHRWPSTTEAGRRAA